MAWEVMAVLASGLFAGAAVYINLVEHPARVQCGTELAVTQFGPSYHRATFLQVSLAVTGFAAGAAAWISGSGLGWLFGGVALGSVMPFTLLVIFPTNKRLLDPALDRRSQLARDLLNRWVRLHAVRSVLGLGAFILFVWLFGFRA
jgi:Anthrone oxygenase